MAYTANQEGRILGKNNRSLSLALSPATKTITVRLLEQPNVGEVVLGATEVGELVAFLQEVQANDYTNIPLQSPK